MAARQDPTEAPPPVAAARRRFGSDACVPASTSTKRAADTGRPCHRACGPGRGDEACKNMNKNKDKEKAVAGMSVIGAVVVPAVAALVAKLAAAVAAAAGAAVFAALAALERTAAMPIGPSMQTAAKRTVPRAQDVTALVAVRVAGAAAAAAPPH